MGMDPEEEVPRSAVLGREEATDEGEGKAGGKVKGAGFPVGPEEKRTEKCREIFRFPGRWGTAGRLEVRGAPPPAVFLFFL
jgi:hypothetical protein